MNPKIPIMMIVFALAAMFLVIMCMDYLADRVASCTIICTGNNMTFLDIDDMGCGCIESPGIIRYFMDVG